MEPKSNLSNTKQTFIINVSTRVISERKAHTFLSEETCQHSQPAARVETFHNLVGMAALEPCVCISVTPPPRKPIGPQHVYLHNGSGKVSAKR